MPVDELGDQLLPDAALTGDEHRRVRGRHPLGQLDHRLERRRLAQQDHLVVMLEGRVEEMGVLLGLAADQYGVRRAADEHLQLRGGEGLRQVVPGTLSKGIETRLHRGVAGHHDSDQVRIGFERGAYEHRPRNLGQKEVGEQDVEGLSPQEVARFIAATGERDAVAVQTEDGGAGLPERRVVFDHQDADIGLCFRVEREQRGDGPGSDARFGRRGGRFRRDDGCHGSDFSSSGYPLIWHTSGQECGGPPK